MFYTPNPTKYPNQKRNGLNLVSSQIGTKTFKPLSVYVLFLLITGYNSLLWCTLYRGGLRVLPPIWFIWL